jgi:hypothetical protein
MKWIIIAKQGSGVFSACVRGLLLFNARGFLPPAGRVFYYCKAEDLKCLFTIRRNMGERQSQCFAKTGGEMTLQQLKEVFAVLSATPTCKASFVTVSMVPSCKIDSTRLRK